MNPVMESNPFDRQLNHQPLNQYILEFPSKRSPPDAPQIDIVDDGSATNGDSTSIQNQIDISHRDHSMSPAVTYIPGGRLNDIPRQTASDTLDIPKVPDMHDRKSSDVMRHRQRGRPVHYRRRTSDSSPPASPKSRHNIAEQRYRDNFNAEIERLRRCLSLGKEGFAHQADKLQGLSKATLVAAATQEITHAIAEKERLEQESRDLQGWIRETISKCDNCPTVMQYNAARAANNKTLG